MLQNAFIEVIPEIDMPGHATAAAKAYPDFSGGGSAKFPDFTFNPGKDGYLPFSHKYFAHEVTSTLSFTNTFISEVMKYLTATSNGPTLPEIQQLMKKENLKDLAGC